MVIANFEMIAEISIIVVIILSLIAICYSLYIIFCQCSCASNFCCNIRQNSPTDDSIPPLDVLYIAAISKGSTEDTSSEKNSNDDDDDQTERENKKNCSKIFFTSKEENDRVESQ